MESKALIQSPTSTTKIRPVPLKTLSPNRNKTSQSPSQSPMRIQVVKNEESPEKLKSVIKNVKLDSEIKFKTAIASPKQSASHDREGTADEISSPDIIFKDI